MRSHFDATDNFFFQAYGRKKAYIAHPREGSEKLYAYPKGHAYMHITQVDFGAPDVDRFPRFAEIAMREVVLGPGDLFFLPAKWWHQFEQPFEASMSVNIWTSPKKGWNVLRNPQTHLSVLHDDFMSNVMKNAGPLCGRALRLLSRNGGRIDRGASVSADDVDLQEKVVAALRWSWDKFVREVREVRSPDLRALNADGSVGGVGSQLWRTSSEQEILAGWLQPGQWDYFETEAWAGWRPGTPWARSDLAPSISWLRPATRKDGTTALYADRGRTHDGYPAPRATETQGPAGTDGGARPLPGTARRSALTAAEL
jgi:hypothetical protein